MQFKSQAGQDEWVLKMLENKTGGYFIDIGAHDGITLSNSYALEKDFGWTGICIEPARIPFNSLIENRRCICVYRAMSDKNETVNFREIPGDTFAGHIDGEGYQIEAINFRELLRLCGVPKEIDYISLDVEGTEFKILKEFPFEEYNVRLWTIEHTSVEDNGRSREVISEFMKSKGYQMTPADKYGHDEGFYWK